jgi:hypothetical protein
MCSSEEGPPVMQAVLENDSELVLAELNKGSDVNEKDEVRGTANGQRSAMGTNRVCLAPRPSGLLCIELARTTELIWSMRTTTLLKKGSKL